MESIFEDYINKVNKAISFFPYPPTMEGIKEKIKEIEKKVASPEICEYLEQYNSSLNCGDRALENIKKLRQGAKVIMTGQQCGLLGGPLYSIYKALTAIKLAEEISQKTKQDVIPVFWIADEDHDWQEINNNTFLDQDSIPRKFKIAKEVKDKPAYLIENDSSTLEDLLIFLDSLGLNNNSYLPEIKKTLKTTYDENFSTWFAKIMTNLLKEDGLIFIDSKAPILKEQGKNIFNQMLEQRDQIVDILSLTSNTIENKGYFLQNPFNQREESNLFIIEGGFRYKLKKNKLGMTIKTGKQYSLEQIKELIEGLKASPNVFLRPVIQDCSFPTIAYVGGPGEINYMAQIPRMYQHLLGEKLPVIFPRQSFMIIEPFVKKILKRYTLNYPHIHNIEHFKKGLIHNKDWTNIDGDFQDLRNDIIHQYSQLIDKISTVNPQLSTIGEKNLQLVLNQVDFLHNKTFNFHKENNTLMIRHMDKLQSNLFPFNIEQQRNLNVFYYLVKYHKHFLHKLIESIDLDNFELQYLEM